MTVAGELTIEQRLALLEARMLRLERAMPLAGIGARPERLIASSPVDPNTRGGWGGDWFDATGYAMRYGSLGHYHTGADLNRPGYNDSGMPVYAAADGRVVFAGKVRSWQGDVVVLVHSDGVHRVWTRYAHITSVVMVGREVLRGEIIGRIADYAPLNDKRGDHLHFDVALVDLGANPADWPGGDEQRVRRDYLDPLQWLMAHG